MAFSNSFIKLCDLKGAVEEPSHRNEFKSGQESSSKMISQTMQTSPQRNQEAQRKWLEEQEPEDHPDGPPHNYYDDDPELARKRKELQAIQEQIVLKRASLSLKAVDSKTLNPGLCFEESNETLQDKVKLILMQHNEMMGRELPPRSQVVVETRSSINIQHDHPLKNRVKGIFQLGFPTAKTQNSEQIQFSRAPLCPKIDTPPVEEEKGHQGFMHFLNILNQGVDIEKLKEIVNDDSESMSYPPQPPQPLQPLQLPQPQHNSQSRGETYGETSSCTSQGKQNVPNPDEQQKHLQNILQSLGLSLGTDEISKMSDRTQERLYGKRQKEAEGDKTLNEKPQMAMERLLKEGEKYSPAHYTRISSSSSSSLSSRRSPPKTQSLLRQRSHSSSDRHRSYKSSHRYRSPPSSSRRLGRSRSPYRCRNTNSPYRRRDSRSPHERGNTNSPYMRRDSHSIHVWSSPNPGDLGDPLQFQPPTQVCPYPPLQCFNPHFQPPQMYPDPYALCAYNQLPAPPPEFHNQQIEPDNSKSSLEIDNMAGTSNKHRIPVLVYLDQMSVSESWRNTKRFRKYQKYLGMKALKKQQRREFLAKQEQDRAKMCTAAKPAHTSEVPPITAGNNCKKKKKKKKLVFTERTEEMKELLNNRPGPVTRALGKKNPAKLLDYNGKLVDIQDVVVPLRELWDDIPFPVIASMTRTYSEVVITEPKVEEPMLTEEEIKVEEPMLTEEEIKVEEPMLTKEEIKVEEPVLTEEEIKANLKLKLEAFNSRMKKKDAQPAQLLTPHSVKVEENI